MLAPPRPWPLREHPAFSHEPEFGWALVSCHFNPAQHRRPVHNLGAFLDWCHANRLPLWMAELSFHDAPALLPQCPHVRHFRLGEDGVMFQKEALLSRMVPDLPKSVEYVFLVDADVIYENPGCFWAASQAMANGARLVQPFSRAVWLDQTGARGMVKPSMAAGFVNDGPPPATLLDTHYHHPGFAVGMPRDFFTTVGAVYGCPITGSGDLALMQAALAPHCPPPRPGRSNYSAPCPIPWQASVAAYVAGRVASVLGEARHFWHGSTAARAYGTRFATLEGFDFARHLQADRETGLPVWAPSAARFQRAMRAYFTDRAEDEPAI